MEDLKSRILGRSLPPKTNEQDPPPSPEKVSPATLAAIRAKLSPPPVDAEEPSTTDTIEGKEDTDEPVLAVVASSEQTN